MHPSTFIPIARSTRSAVIAENHAAVTMVFKRKRCVTLFRPPLALTHVGSSPNALCWLNAAVIVCAHNDPSGDAEPRTAKRAVTKRIGAVLALLDIRQLDHFVVGAEVAVSFVVMGWV